MTITTCYIFDCWPSPLTGDGASDDGDDEGDRESEELVAGLADRRQPHARLDARERLLDVEQLGGVSERRALREDLVHTGKRTTDSLDTLASFMEKCQIRHHINQIEYSIGTY